MSVYIPGTEMPKSCHECVAGYGGCCFVAPAESDGICPDQGRADFCPLVPVPDHGRLVDAFNTVKKLCDSGYYNAAEIVSNMPTVIPASGGKENE
jgi:hypothetical protein